MGGSSVVAVLVIKLCSTWGIAPRNKLDTIFDLKLSSARFEQSGITDCTWGGEIPAASVDWPCLGAGTAQVGPARCSLCDAVGFNELGSPRCFGGLALFKVGTAHASPVWT